MTVNKNLNRNGVPRACSILGMDFDSHKDRNKYFGLENYSIDLIEKRFAKLSDRAVVKPHVQIVHRYNYENQFLHLQIELRFG
jgi:hypothetical protein